jgi:hypothetical protein
MHATKKRAVLAALVVSGLMLVGTACGGSSSKSSDSASGSGSSSASTSKSSGGGGSDSSKCSELLKKSEALAAKMEASSSGDSADMSANVNSMIKDLESFTSTVPSEIRGDWKTIVDAFKDYASALEGINMNNLTDPATMDKLTKAGAALDSAKVQKASDNLDAWTKKNCPSLAGN